MSKKLWSMAVGAALLAAACGGGAGGDRAGGSDEPARKTTLTLALPQQGEPNAQVQAWADEVERLSGDTLTIEWRPDWRGDDDPAARSVDYEAETLADVRDGRVDLALVGARAFDTVGVTSFQPLLAPLLVDSHDLQGAVFDAGIPDDMLDGVAEIDVVGLGVLPGPMRNVLGKAEPYLGPEDYDGSTVGIQQSELAARTFEALGATATPLPSGAALDAVDGYEQQLGSIWGNHYEDVAGYVTTNVNLWPRPLVIVGDPDALGALTEDQRDALRRAADDAGDEALAASRDEAWASV